MNLGELDDLIEAFVEGEIDEEGQRKLNDAISQNPEMGVRLARASKNDLFLKQMLARDLEADSKIIKINQRKKKNRKLSNNSSGWFWPTVLSLASCLVLGLTMVWLSSLNSSDSGKPAGTKESFVQEIQESAEIEILALEGDVKIKRGEVLKYMMLGDYLAQNDKIVCGSDSRIKFKLSSENTIYHLDPNSSMVMLDEQGKRWSLSRGNVGALVDKQKGGARVVFETRHANIEVLGTILQVMASDEESKLSVFEGAVKMLRLSDQKTQIVKEGHYTSTQSENLKHVKIGVSDQEDIEVVALSLIDVKQRKPFIGYDYKKDLGEIQLNSLGSRVFNLDIHTKPKVIGSLRFTVTGPNGLRVSKVENFYPYTLGNKDESLSPFDLPNYDEYDLRRGEYRVEVTPFTKMREGGKKGATKVFTFLVR